MALVVKKLFEDEEEKKQFANLSPVENKEPMSKHIGTNHKIVKGPPIIGVPEYFICQPCCMEVYDDDDDCGILMF